MDVDATVAERRIAHVGNRPSMHVTPYFLVRPTFELRARPVRAVGPAANGYESLDISL